MLNKYLNKRIMGCDETGVGDYFSSIVAVACFVPLNQMPFLINLGIKDSKKISDNKIKYLYNQIRNKVSYTYRYLSPAGYNKLNNSLNAHEIKTFLHVNAISALEKRLIEQKEKIDLIILDQYVQSEIFWKYVTRIKNLNLSLGHFATQLIMKIRGESEHISVAIASIFARYHLLRLQAMQNKKWNFVFPLGANKNVDERAKKFVSIHGENNLINVAKIKFKNTERILKL